MLVSENWLREWVNPAWDSAALADALTMGGLEVDNVRRQSAAFRKVVVGRIDQVDRHPRRANLRVCTVNIGRSRPLQVVCGAPNAAAGVTTAVALIGGRIKDGREIHKARIHGIVSSGMLCSAAELDLGDDASGLIIFDAGVTAGADIKAHLALDDAILELKLTPNRGDCLSMRGVAREVAVLSGARLTAPAVKAVAARSSRRAAIKVDDKNGCPRYAGRVLSGVNAAAATPDWMRERLRRAGLRSIGAVVDVTNFVMLELGQPMHAFDLASVDGGIIVRRAARGERLRLLDGAALALGGDMLVIADHRRPLALAGIMGGAASGISEAATEVLLESACFDPPTVAATARRLGLNTDAAHRFERGVDPALQVAALHRASRLLIDICGGTAGPVVDRASRRHLPAKNPVLLRHARVRRVLGQSVASAKIEKIIRGLGMKTRKTVGGLKVTPPTWRWDVDAEHDLIEEVARVNGYQRVPVAAATTSPASAQLPPENRNPVARLRDCLAARDFQEAVTYSFVAPQAQALFDDARRAVRLQNPIAANMRDMRMSLWPGLLLALAHNYNRQHRRIRLFEIGAVWRPGRNGGAPREEQRIGAVATGAALSRQWGAPPRAADFFDLKGDLCALLSLAGFGDGGGEGEFQFTPARRRGLRDGQCARLSRGGKNCGWIGRLSPQAESFFAVEQAVFAFELSLDAALVRPLPVYQPAPLYPSVSRDLSFLVAQAVAARDLHRAIRKSAGGLLSALELFDVYQGAQGIDGAGKKSVSFRLTFQSPSRTLKDAEVDAAVADVLRALGEEFSIALRTAQPA